MQTTTSSARANRALFYRDIPVRCDPRTPSSACRAGLLAALLFLATSTTADGAFIANGNINLTINDTTGAFNSLRMHSTVEFLDHAGPLGRVGNWGIMRDFVSDSFRLNSMEGSVGIPVTVTQVAFNQIDVTGTYTVDGYNLGFVRSYRAVPGETAFRIDTRLTNNHSSSTANFFYFDSFDPDQGEHGSPPTPDTNNDAFPFMGGQAAIARAANNSEYTLAIGTQDPRALISSGGPYGGISDANVLSNMLNNPADGPDGNFSTDILYKFIALAPGESTRLVTHVALGANTFDAHLISLANAMVGPGTIWDSNGQDPGAGIPFGKWSDFSWTNDINGNSPSGLFNHGQTAIFTANTNSFQAYLIDVDVDATVGGLTFRDAHPGINGSDNINLLDDGGSITLTGRNVDVQAANVTAHIAAILRAVNAEGLDKLGPGRLILSGNNSFSGAGRISNGVLEARHPNALPHTTNVNAGATLELAGTDLSGKDVTLFGTGFPGQLGTLINSSTIGAASIRNVTIAATGGGAPVIATLGQMLNINGVINGNGLALDIDSFGTIDLRSPNALLNVFANIFGGTLRVSANQGLNSPINVFGGGTLETFGSITLGTGHGVTLNDQGRLVASSADGTHTATLGGPLNVFGTGVVIADNRVELYGALGGTGRINKGGDKALVIRGGVTGLERINIFGGNLLYQDTGFGSWAGTVAVNSAASLSGWGSQSTAVFLFLNGGTLKPENGGTNTYIGSVEVNQASTIDTSNGNVTFTGNLTGFQSLTHTGGGIFTFAGVGLVSNLGRTINNTAGILNVTGSLDGNINLAGGTLAGDGTIGSGNVTLADGARLAPGASAGTLTMELGETNSLDISAAVADVNSQALEFELAEPGASDHVLLTSGLLNIGDGLLDFDDFLFATLAGFRPALYTLFTAAEPIVGSLGLNLAGTIEGHNAFISLSPDGRSILLSVPEPATALLWALGAAVMLLLTGRPKNSIAT